MSAFAGGELFPLSSNPISASVAEIGFDVVKLCHYIGPLITFSRVGSPGWGDSHVCPMQSGRSRNPRHGEVH